jgi:hypothetical protein
MNIGNISFVFEEIKLGTLTLVGQLSQRAMEIILWKQPPGTRLFESKVSHLCKTCRRSCTDILSHLSFSSFADQRRLRCMQRHVSNSRLIALVLNSQMAGTKHFLMVSETNSGSRRMFMAEARCLGLTFARHGSP